MKLCSCENIKVNGELTDVVNFLKVISEEKRLKILCVLQKGDLCVCEIWENLNLPQNLVSHHLKVLKDFGLVESRKESTKVIYSLNPEKTKKYIKLLSHYI